MKILHVLPSLSREWGGPPVVVGALVSALTAYGVDCTVFAAEGRRVGYRDIKIDAARIQTFPTGKFSRFWTAHAPSMAGAIDEIIPEMDVVHLHEIWHYPHFLAARAARRAGKPYIVTVHGELEPWALAHRSRRKRMYMALLQKKLINQASALHAITTQEARQFSDLGLVPPTHVIPNGVHTAPFETDCAVSIRDDLADRVGDRKIVLFLGRLHPKKGLDLLVKAFSEISTGRGDMVLVIAGPDDGGYRSDVEQMVRSSNIADKTIFTGMLDGEEKVAMLKSADVFVLPSYSEVLGIAVLEAMAAGIPVLISRACQFPEVGEAGAGIEVDTDVDELSNALRYMIDRPERILEMGESGRRLVRERYRWPIVAKRISQLYEDVIAAA